MHNGTARELHGDLVPGACSFGYAGAFPDEHTARLIEFGAAVLDAQSVRAPERGRLSYVMVEAYQNVVRHRARLEPRLEQAEGRCHFLLQCAPGAQTVATLNPVASPKAKDLHEVLGFLRTRTSEELKTLFREGIQREHDPDRRGAGLGLIEMMRRSGATPHWRRQDVLQGHELFAMAWTLGNMHHADGLDQLDRQRGAMQQADAWLSFSGPALPDVMEALARLLEAEADQAGTGTPHADLLRALPTWPGTPEGPVTVLVGNQADGAWLQVGTVLRDAPHDRMRHPAVSKAIIASEPTDGGTWVLLSWGPTGEAPSI